MDLSILIPARNEMFLRRTIEDILEHMEGDTEIIAVCVVKPKKSPSSRGTASISNGLRCRFSTITVNFRATHLEMVGQVYRRGTSRVRQTAETG